jgi:hypothetical protein
MKKLIAAVFFLVSVIVADSIAAQKIIAQSTTPSQPPGMCYSQCGFYKFYWRGDFCYDMVKQQCGASFNLKDVVSMVKSIRTAFLTGKLTEIVDVKQIFVAWLICKPLIEDCIVPQLSACENTCASNTLTYAPNLTVGSDFSYFHGLYYNDEDKTLTMRTMNTGLGYAWDIGVSMSYGTTDKQDGSGMSSHTYFSETIPQLLFLGSRQAAPRGVADVVTDFLIDESNFSKFLSRFKSDAEYEYVPPGWEKTIPFGAPDGMLTRIILNVDPNQDIAESNESDNTFILEIDKRPKPPSYDITDIELFRQGNTLTDYLVRFSVKNSGELAGDAKLSLSEGTTVDGANPFYNETQRILADDSVHFEKLITVDVSNGSPSCSTSKRFTATVTDDKGLARTVRFEIPLYAGVISGSVTNTKGKAVVGATVTASTGQTATTSGYGVYRISGIPTLGKVTVTISHPSYTETQTKEATLTLDASTSMAKACNTEGLSVSGVDGVLRDIPVKLTIRFKNSSGNLLDGTALLTGPAGTKTYEVNGEKVIEEADVGQFSVTASSPGYVTKFVQSMLTPPEQTLEIVLEKLNGRPDDGGLSLIAPIKIWEKTLPNKVEDIEGSKNGKLLVMYTSKNTPDSGALHFINPINGEIVKSVSVPATKGNQQEGLDVSYDGRTVGFMVNPGGAGLTEVERIVKVFGPGGNELASTTVDRHNASKMAVSPDGFYLYPTSLMNNTLYKYTRLEMEGVGEKALQTYAASEELKFLRNNTIVGSCKTGLCIRSLNGAEVRTLGRTKGAVRFVDATNDDATVIARTDDGLAYFGSNFWEKDFDRAPDFVSTAITPGGQYVILARGGAGGKWLTLSVLDAAGADKTPDFTYEDVRYVEANDRGMFFTQVRSNKVSYFQIGKYANEYKPPVDSQTETQTQSSDFRIYVNSDNTFTDTGYAVSWDSMYPGIMYRAKKDLTLHTAWGKITVSRDTVIAKGPQGEPVLLWGQAEVEAQSPITMMILKSKLFEPSVMSEKIGLYISGSLPTDQYVLIRNLHTAYAIASGKGGVSVAVKNGSIEITHKSLVKEIKAGQQAEISDDGKIVIGLVWMRWIGWAAAGLCTIIIGILLFRFRKSKFVSGLFAVLRLIVRYALIVIKTVFVFIRKALTIFVRFLLFLKQIIKKSGKVKS